MKKSKFSESAIVRAVQQLESGVTADVICRELAISRQTLYTWRSKYSGMEISQVKKMKELKEENHRLKQMYADLSLDYRILKDIIEKTLEPEVKKELAEEISVEENICTARACKIMDICLSFFLLLSVQEG